MVVVAFEEKSRKDSRQKLKKVTSTNKKRR